MQEYEVRRGHFKHIEGDNLRELMVEIFGNAEESEGKFVCRFGAISKLTAWSENGLLYIETEMNKDVDDDTAQKTIKAYNQFLEGATGFTSKQRRDRLQKKAKRGM